MADVRVIIPTFNRAVELVGALDSVFNQTYGDYEVIVVDDGSSDDTLARLAPIVAHDSRVRVISTPHGGVAAARNAGITADGGFRYAAFLDSDDRWTREHLESAVTILEHEPSVSLAFAAFVTEDHTGTWTPAEMDERRRRVYRPVELAARTTGTDAYVLDPRRTLSALARGWFSPATPTVVVRAADVWKGPWFDPTFIVISDVEFFFRLAATLAPWAFVPTTHCTVRFLGDNLTRSRDLSSPTTLAKQRVVLQFCERKLASCSAADRRDVRRGLAQQAYLVGQCCGEQGDQRGARAAYLQSLRAALNLPAMRSLVGTYLRPLVPRE